MNDKPFLRAKRITISPDDAKKIFDEFHSRDTRKPLSDKQKKLYQDIWKQRTQRLQREALQNIHKYIEENTYSTEELQGLLEVIQNKLNN